MYHRPSLTKQWRNSVSNLLPLLNCLTNTHKNHEIFPHFATLKIAFLVTFLYIFLHNHKDMVNLKNIFFFQKPFFKFYHREKRQFRRLSDRLCNTVENKWMSKVFSVSKYLRCLEYLCKFSTKSVKEKPLGFAGRKFWVENTRHFTV